MEYTTADITLAVATASLVMVGSALVVWASAWGRHADAPAIDIGAGVPVRVVPVLDLDAPALKLGGGRARAKLPDRWARKPKPAEEREAQPSTRAGTAEKDIPPAGVAVTDAGAPPAADAGEPAPPETAAPADTGAPADTAAGGLDAGEGVANAPPGPGDPRGVPEGTETDPLKARAADVYRSRLIAWFSSRFRVSGSGLPQATLTKLRAQATVQLTADRRVAGYTLTSSGNAVFDAAARAALEGAKGQELPPPPENYPDLVQTSISLTFVCKEGRCD